MVIHELNSDITIVPSGGQTAPFGVCIVPQPGHCLNTWGLGGDDVLETIPGPPFVRINAGSNGLCETVVPATTYNSTDIPNQLDVLNLLNDVYSQAVVSWSVVHLPADAVDFDNNCDLHIAMTPNNEFTVEEQDIISTIGNPDGLDYMIFLVDRPIPAGYLGHMVLGSKFGFVYIGFDFGVMNDQAPATIAHELGHGQGLCHPDEYFCRSDPDTHNLMYSGHGDIQGKKLRKYQWDILNR